MELYEKTNENEKLDNLILDFEKMFNQNSSSILYKSHLLYKNDLYKDVINNLSKLKFENNIQQEIDRVNLIAKSYDKINETSLAFSYFEKSNLLNLKNKNNEIDKNRFLNKIKKRINFFKKKSEFKLFSSTPLGNNQYLCLVFQDLEQLFWIQY